MADVVELPTKRAKEARSLEDFMADLAGAHQRGKVREILYAYIDDKGCTNFGISGSTGVKNAAWMLACLQERLTAWISKSG